MKTKPLSIALIWAIAIILWGSNLSFAQPNLLDTNQPPFTIAGLFTGNAVSDIKGIGQDLVSFVERTGTSNGIVTIEAGGLYVEHDKTYGGFLNGYLPIGGTNSVFGAGFGVAYVEKNLYDGTINARLGDKFNLPLVRIPLYAYIESGGGWNFDKHEAIAQAFAGASLAVPITRSQTFTIGGALGTISDISGNILAFGLSYTWKW